MDPQAQIQDVDKSTESYVLKNDKMYIVLYGILIVGTVYAVIAFQWNPVLIVIPVSFAIGGYLHVKARLKRQFTQQFGASIGFTYTPTADMSTVSGRLFSIGRAQRIYDVLSGTQNGRPTRIFSYQYTVGSGKSSHTEYSTVFETRFSNDMPDIVLTTKQLGYAADMPPFGGGERVELEGDFNKYFSLKVPKGYEQEAYEIFTPDIMATLIDRAKDLNFEFNGPTLYIYSDWLIMQRDRLQAMFDLAEYLEGLFQRSSRAVDVEPVSI